MSVAAAISFVWLGMVVAISFLEAPLKFRAPGVTIPIGLGIGRLVFRALNAFEAVFAGVIVIALVVAGPPVAEAVAAGVPVAVLAAQLLLVRPRLTRRSDAILAGGQAPRSRAHHAYAALEAVKAVALIVGGVLLLTS